MNTRDMGNYYERYYSGVDPWGSVDASVKIIHDTILIEPASSKTTKPIDCGLEFRTIPKFKL